MDTLKRFGRWVLGEAAEEAYNRYGNTPQYNPQTPAPWQQLGPYDYPQGGVNVGVGLSTQTILMIGGFLLIIVFLIKG